jgi:hypothetical protein
MIPLFAANLTPRLHTPTSNARITLWTDLAISILATFFPRQSYLPLLNVNKVLFIFLAFSPSPSHLRAEYVSTFTKGVRSVMQDGTINANIGSGGDVVGRR